MAMGSPLDNVVRENFVKLDKDRSGFLDQKELGALLDDCLNEKERKDQVRHLHDNLLKRITPAYIDLRSLIILY